MSRDHVEGAAAASPDGSSLSSGRDGLPGSTTHSTRTSPSRPTRRSYIARSLGVSFSALTSPPVSPLLGPGGTTTSTTSSHAYSYTSAMTQSASSSGEVTPLTAANDAVQQQQQPPTRGQRSRHPSFALPPASSSSQSRSSQPPQPPQQHSYPRQASTDSSRRSSMSAASSAAALAANPLASPSLQSTNMSTGAPPPMRPSLSHLESVLQGFEQYTRVRSPGPRGGRGVSRSVSRSVSRAGAHRDDSSHSRRGSAGSALSSGIDSEATSEDERDDSGGDALFGPPTSSRAAAFASSRPSSRGGAFTTGSGSEGTSVQPSASVTPTPVYRPAATYAGRPTSGTSLRSTGLEDEDDDEQDVHKRVLEEEDWLEDDDDDDDEGDADEGPDALYTRLSRRRAAREQRRLSRAASRSGGNAGLPHGHADDNLAAAVRKHAAAEPSASPRLPHYSPAYSLAEVDVLSEGERIGLGVWLEGRGGYVRDCFAAQQQPNDCDASAYEQSNHLVAGAAGGPGELEVVRRLGEGTYAIVYLVREVLYDPDPNDADDFLALSPSDSIFSFPPPMTPSTQESPLLSSSQSNSISPTRSTVSNASGRHDAAEERSSRRPRFTSWASEVELYANRNTRSRGATRGGASSGLTNGSHANGEDDSAATAPGTMYGRNFALKCLCKKDLTDELIEIQRGEAILHGSLPSHEYIVQLYGAYETDDWLFLVLEYCPGQDLFYWLDERQDDQASLYDYHSRATSPLRSHLTSPGSGHTSSPRRRTSMDVSAEPRTSPVLEVDESSVRTATGRSYFDMHVKLRQQREAEEAEAARRRRRASRDAEEFHGEGDTPPSPSLLASNDSLLSRKRLRLIARMFGQMCSALEACHRVGISHRDLKPENFIVMDGRREARQGSGEGRVVVKVTDWGLGTRERVCEDFDCGSKPYMAYECRNNLRPTYDPVQADIWSLGLVLLNLLFHRNPWADPVLEDPDFAEYVHDPVGFLEDRFHGIGTEVATFLADHVFCDVLEIGEDGRERQRVTAADFGKWAERLVIMMGEGKRKRASASDAAVSLAAGVSRERVGGVGVASSIGSGSPAGTGSVSPPAAVRRPTRGPSLLSQSLASSSSPNGLGLTTTAPNSPSRRESDLPADLSRRLQISASMDDDDADTTLSATVRQESLFPVEALEARRIEKLERSSSPPRPAWTSSESLPSLTFSDHRGTVESGEGIPFFSSPEATGDGSLPSPSAPSSKAPSPNSVVSPLPRYATVQSPVSPPRHNTSRSRSPPQQHVPFSPLAQTMILEEDTPANGDEPTVETPATAAVTSEPVDEEVSPQRDGDVPASEGDCASVAAKSKRRKRGARKNRSTKSVGVDAGTDTSSLASPTSSAPTSPPALSPISERDRVINDLASASQDLARELSRTRPSSSASSQYFGTQSAGAISSKSSNSSAVASTTSKRGGMFGKMRSLVKDGNPDLEAFKQRVDERNTMVGANFDTYSAPAKLQHQAIRSRLDSGTTSLNSLGTASWGSVESEESGRGRGGPPSSHWSSASERRERLDRQRRRVPESSSPASSSRMGTTSTVESRSTLHSPLSSFSSVGTDAPLDKEWRRGDGLGSEASSRSRSRPPGRSKHEHGTAPRPRPHKTHSASMRDAATDTTDLDSPPGSLPQSPEIPGSLASMSGSVATLKETVTVASATTTPTSPTSRTPEPSSTPSATKAPKSGLAKLLTGMSVFNQRTTQDKH